MISRHLLLLLAELTGHYKYVVQGFSLNIIGMLSKSYGQVFRFAVAVQVLFAIDNDHEGINISEAALTATINFVQVANKQTIIIARRETPEEEIKTNTREEPESVNIASANKVQKVRNKDTVIRCFFMLEENGLGKILQLTGMKGTGVVQDLLYTFTNNYYAYCFVTGQQSHCNQILLLDLNDIHPIAHLWLFLLAIYSNMSLTKLMCQKRRIK